MSGLLSQTDVANLALDYLDEVSIQDLSTDVTNPGRWMKRNLFPVAYAIMRSHPWNFARARAYGVAGPTPAFEWAYSYAYPVDCLRVLPLTSDGTEDGPDVLYRVEGQYILTNQAAPLPIRYISRVSNVGLWDNSFCDAVASALALKAAHLITGKAAYVQILTPIAANMLLKAQMLDSLEGSALDAQNDDWIKARQ